MGDRVSSIASGNFASHKRRLNMAKINSVINVSIGTVAWAFPSGKVITLHLERCSQPIRDYAVLHGLSAKGTDSMALKAEDFGGRIPEEAKIDALAEMVDYLESG